MAHYARVVHGHVTDVIIADESFIHNLPQEQGVEWIETSPCSFEGKIIDCDCEDCEHRDKPLRMNYAQVGGTYNKELDAFIPLQEYPSWMFDIKTCSYVPRIPKPEMVEGKFWDWNESKLCWELSD